MFLSLVELSMFRCEAVMPDAGMHDLYGVAIKPKTRSIHSDLSNELACKGTMPSKDENDKKECVFVVFLCVCVWCVHA